MPFEDKDGNLTKALHNNNRDNECVLFQNLTNLDQSRSTGRGCCKPTDWRLRHSRTPSDHPLKTPAAVEMKSCQDLTEW